VRILDVANHLRTTKIEGMSDIYETHYCVPLDGLLIVTEGRGWRFCKCNGTLPLRTFPECSMPEPYRLWFLPKLAEGLNTN
jgi:hypothetical protein